MNDGQDRNTLSIPKEDAPTPSPELLGLLGSLLGSVKPTPQTASSSVSTSDTAPMPADWLGTLLSNPEMMEKLPQMIAVIKPMLASMPSPKKEEPTNDSKEHARDRLLLSLKPFLSKSRCDAIDTMLQISRLGNVFQQLK